MYFGGLGKVPLEFPDSQDSLSRESREKEIPRERLRL